MLKHMAKPPNQEKEMHVLPYGFLLTRVFEYFRVPFRGPKKETKKDMFDEEPLKEYGYVARLQAPKVIALSQTFWMSWVIPIRKKRR